MRPTGTSRLRFNGTSVTHWFPIGSNVVVALVKLASNVTTARGTLT
jgi:hypothetical protein